MDFGIALSKSNDVATEAREAEAIGYDFVTSGEHVFFYGPTTNGLITLAAAAGATRTIRLMSSITLVPLYPPALLAKQVAALDIVSGGRFELGVGVGGEFEKEFEACGVPKGERGARTDEALEVMQRLWQEEDVHFDGRFVKLSGVTLEPKPVQAPHPPIWISGRSEAAIRRAARFGSGWLPYMYTPEMLATSAATVREHTDREVRNGLFIFFAVHRNGETGRAMATAKLSKQYNQDFSKLVGKYALSGSVDDCSARLREYADAGVETVILSSACPPEYVEENQRLMAEEVVPRLRP